MAISREEVDHVATLARLDLTDDEKETLREQLSKILEHARKVTSLDTEGVPPTSHAMKLVNVAAEDLPHEPLAQDEALANAPHADQSHFRVPRIIEDAG